MFKPRIPQVALLAPLVLKGHQDTLRGILQYIRLHGPWRLYRMEGRPGEQKLLDLKRWGCTGIITSACNRATAKVIARANVPVVVFEPSPEMRAHAHPLSRCASTRCDSFAIGQRAAHYFLERHYTRFAFVGEPHGLYWSREREQGFKSVLQALGLPCFVYGVPAAKARRDWSIEQPHMLRWLRSLPKPIALFAAMDGRGRQVLDACMGAEIAVPSEVAVLGVDDDELICEATFPTMSSIQINAQQTGYLIAEHLDHLMRGKRPPQTVFFAQPTRVVTRRSTDATAIPDRQIAQALEFIWQEAGRKAIHVPDVVRQIGASRRFAEIRFRTIVGRTILEEIQRVRLERVCALLAETNLSVGEITRQCGFERESYLARLFKKRFSTSMSRYRADVRRSKDPAVVLASRKKAERSASAREKPRARTAGS